MVNQEPEFRQLFEVDAGMIAMIDRSELIDGFYRPDRGSLRLESAQRVVEGWYPSEPPDHATKISQRIADGGAAFGAFVEGQIVGIAALDTRGVGGDPRIMQLEPLFVSAPWRHRGIGTRLVSMVADAARIRGATALYISSTPTRNSVEAYLRMGAVVLAVPDPMLFAAEPEDVHLLLTVE